MQSLRCDPSGTRGRFWLHGSSQQVLGGVDEHVVSLPQLLRWSLRAI